MSHDDKPKQLSPDLWRELIQVFALGYCDTMKGCDVTNEDEIDLETAGEIEDAAMAYLGEREESIHDLYLENPTKVYGQAYSSGSRAYQQRAIAWLQRN